MMQADVVIDGVTYPVLGVNTLVIGSGAAGLNAALCLHDRGQTDIAILTEAWGGGASANAGSDKQTYYKLSLAGDEPDSPRLMAKDLAAGGSMHGDVALCEAQHSAQAFFRLVQLGVPFPHDIYGGYVGYKTDHDPRGRATSAGPLTSRLMFEALAREVRAKQVPVLDRHQVVGLLVDDRTAEPGIAGAVALVLPVGPDAPPRFVLFSALNVVLATGGPGGMYADSVYPVEQTGSIGLALRAGANAQNLTESQFGLASIRPRWNVSGSYQQAVPRYVSTDETGGNQCEFLNEAFPDAATLATATFRKGYEWPFDASKVGATGSSLIDLLVFRERVERGRRVFLDYTTDPCAEALGRPLVEVLDPEASRYLSNCGATGATPIDRLRAMNMPAVDLYRRHGIDLAGEMLEVAVCAQHSNGGLEGNCWWESNIRGLFPVGEVNGSHGVSRPGGSALNAGQVGGVRAAMFIARRRRGRPPDPASLANACREQVRAIAVTAERAVEGRARPRLTIFEALHEIRARMSRHGGIARSPAAVRQAVEGARALCERVFREPLHCSAGDLPDMFRTLDLTVAHLAYLEAIGEYIERGGQSRGSFVVPDEFGTVSAPGLGAGWRFSLNEPGAFVERHVQRVSIGRDGEVRKTWVPTRPVPATDSWFERVWKAYRDDEVIG